MATKEILVQWQKDGTTKLGSCPAASRTDNSDTRDLTKCKSLSWLGAAVCHRVASTRNVLTEVVSMSSDEISVSLELGQLSQTQGHKVSSFKKDCGHSRGLLSSQTGHWSLGSHSGHCACTAGHKSHVNVKRRRSQTGSLR